MVIRDVFRTGRILFLMYCNYKWLNILSVSSNFYVLWVPRLANLSIHTLARWSLNSKVFGFFDLDSCPPYLFLLWGWSWLFLVVSSGLKQRKKEKREREREKGIRDVYIEVMQLQSAVSHLAVCSQISNW